MKIPTRRPGTALHASVAVLASIAMLFVSKEAHARGFARLDYERAEGASRCPSADALEAKVAERLGYDPFRRDADRSVAVRFGGDATRLHAVVRATDAKGSAVGQRELESDEPSCAELADGVALTVSILLDPPTLDLPKPPEVSRDDPRATSRPQAEPAALAPTAPRLIARLGGTALVNAGEAPDATFGFSFFAGIERGPLSLDLEGRADLPSDHDHVRTAIRVVQLAPCGHLRLLFACVLGAVGTISADGVDLDNPQHRTALYGHVGARAGAELPLYTTLVSARLSADVLAPWTRTTLAVGNTDLWTSPDLYVVASAGILMRFP